LPAAGIGIPSATAMALEDDVTASRLRSYPCQIVHLKGKRTRGGRSSTRTQRVPSCCSVGLQAGEKLAHHHHQHQHQPVVLVAGTAGTAGAAGQRAHGLSHVLLLAPASVVAYRQSSCSYAHRLQQERQQLVSFGFVPTQPVSFQSVERVSSTTRV